MRVIQLFVYIFSVFAFLTIGSLMIIVSLQVLTMEDALLKVQAIYEMPWQSLKLGLTGILFVFIGLVFSKMLVKETRSTGEVVLLGRLGYVSVSTKAIEDLVRRGLRKFDVIRDNKIKIEVNGSKLKVMLTVSVLAGWHLPELTSTIQDELSQKINRLLGEGVDLEIMVSIPKVIEEPVEIGI